MVRSEILEENSLGKIMTDEELGKKYGIKIVKCPPMPVVDTIDLSTKRGQEMVASKARVIMKLQRKAFDLLADM